MKILITGGTNGMGKGVAKVLAGINDKSHEIIILGRSKELGEKVIKELNKASTNNKISFVLCDLTKLSDVKKAIQEIQDNHRFLDAIFINAGLGYASERVETIDGMNAHFQVNYLSQFMLTLNMLNLLEKSEHAGRVIFNVTKYGKMFWNDMQMTNNWSYEKAIHQAMLAKRMFLNKLHNLYKKKNYNLSFIGFQIHKTVWSNQINIIPVFLRLVATIMKFFGQFISIEQCGKIMSPLFTEAQEKSIKKSGELISWKKNEFISINEDSDVLNTEQQDKLWKISLKLCADEQTNRIAMKFK